MWCLYRRCGIGPDARAVATQSPVRLLRGRPPVLLGRKVRRELQEVDVQKDPNKAAVPAGPGGLVSFRKLCETASQSGAHDPKALSLLRQAGRLARTPAESALVVNHFAAVSRDEPFIRFMAGKLISCSLAGQSRHVCLAASALARAEVWVPGFGSLVDQIFGHTHPEISFRCLTAIDVAQICRFAAVFRKPLQAMGLSQERVLDAVHTRLQGLEDSGERVEATGLISLLRSVALVSDSMATAPNPSKPFALWLRTRLVKELPLCSPRQLASALLDLGALKLLDDSSLLQIQREVTRNWRSNNMRPRDLASIISAYSKLEGVPARQAAIEPLLPQMLEMMSTLSGASLCELLHGFASANIYDRVLLDEWSDHFAAKVLGSPEGPARYALSPAELSLAVADLAKLRYVKKDTRRSFSALLEQVVDVAPSLGGLAVCHVVCALARVSPATTPTTPTTFTTLATPSALVDSSAAEFRSALLNRLEAQILVKVEELRPQGLSASAAAFVKLRHFSEGLLSGLTAAAATRFASFSAEDFSMFSSAIGTAQQSLAQGWCENHLELLGEHAASALQQGSSAWTPRQVSQVLHPFVAQKRPPQDLIHAAVSHLRKTSTNYSPRDLAKLLSNLHGCGVLHRDAAVAADILQSSERRLRHRGPEIVAVANSLAQLRQVIPVSQLRYRFRRLSISVQLALARNLLSLQDQADVLRIWALVGLRDWRLLAALATNASQAMEAAATKLLTGLGQLPFPAEDLPQAVYAYVKLGAPDSVQPKYRDSILEFLVRAMKALLQVDAVPRLGERALRQLLLGIAFWGPPKRTSPPLESDADSQAGELRQALLKQSLDSWLQLESCNLTGETARMVVASASMEFGVQAAELTAAAATRFRQVQRPQHAVAILSQSMNDLQSYERSVFKALEKLLAARCKAPGPPAVVGQFMAPCCDVRLAVPAWEVAVEVGLKNHLFEGPREAWAEGSEGWGRNPESELDHGPIPGDFIGDEMLEDEQSWFNVDGGEGLDASPGIPWQQLPALRIRLLRASGWKVIEIPYYDWRKLGKLEQQKFLGQLLKPYLSAPMQRIE